MRRVLICVAFGLQMGCASSLPVKDHAHKTSRSLENAPYNRKYYVDNVVYRPIGFSSSYVMTGNASWYGGIFHGRKTSNGERFDKYAMTAASKVLPIPSLAEVTNLSNGKKVVVRINDRGPFVHNRILDLSYRAAKILGCHQKGLTRVRVKYLGPAPAVARAV